jgi:glycosyltransferase involved in cell wall biosynthesis
VTGFTVVTSQLCETLRQKYDLHVVNTTGVGSRTTFSFHISRVLQTCVGLSLILKMASRGGSKCYIACDGGLGVVYALAIAICARICGQNLHVHHHNYSYIDRPAFLMRALLIVGSTKMIHVVLSREMAQKLADRYCRSIRAIVLSNATFVSCGGEPVIRPVGRPLTIGLLSNLQADKGLHTFVEILRIAKLRGDTIRGILAGPIVDAADKTLIEIASDELAGMFEYRGAVYGEEKTKFYHDIDVFVFPSTYRNEAQPVVVFEALANGVPVISYDRGCIRGQIANAGVIVNRGSNFCSVALGVLEHYRRQLGSLALHKVAARSQFIEERQRGERKVHRLFDIEPTEYYPIPNRETRPIAVKQ